MKIRIFGVILFILLLTLGCSIWGWQKYVCVEGTFSIQMPASPTSQKIILDTDFGRTYLYVFMLTNKDGLIYSVSYVDYPDGVFQQKTVDKILDDARNGAVRNVQGKLLSDSKISLEKHPGREMMIDVANGKAIIQGRLFLVNHRLYELVVTAPDKISLANNARRFLDSFEIIEQSSKR